MSRKVTLAILVAVLLTASCGARVYVMTSLKPPRSIEVDGDAQDWGGALGFVEKSGMFVGFVNDQDNLYICLTKPAEEPGPGGRDGLPTVWFDPAGGTKRTLGLRLSGPEGETPPDRDRVDGIAVLGPAGDVQMSLAPESAAELGLEVKASQSEGLVVLEIKIPLRASERTPVAVGAGPDGVFGVGFISSRAKGKRGPGGGGPPGGGPGGSMPGGTGGPRGGGWTGGLRPNLEPDVGQTTKTWVRVRLHQGERPAPATVFSPAAH